MNTRHIYMTIAVLGSIVAAALHEVPVRPRVLSARGGHAAVRSRR
jgi:hypothetical protein